MAQNNFLLEHKDKTTILTITRPEVLNAPNFNLLRELKKTFLDFKNDTKRRVLIITGKGEKAFCAGADMQELSGRHITEEREGQLTGQDTCTTLENLCKPSIAAINGCALGGGLEMALARTFRFALAMRVLGCQKSTLTSYPSMVGPSDCHVS